MTRIHGVAKVADATLAEGAGLVYDHPMGTVVESKADSGGPSVHLLQSAGRA